MQPIYGYFDKPELFEPTYDPGMDAPCLICHYKLSIFPVRTISLMLENDSRSYFYRVHIVCHDSLTEQQQSDLDGLIIDARAKIRDIN